MTEINMLSLGTALPCFAGLERPKTFAAWPVWAGSTTKEIRFQPVPRKAATRLWHRARDFDRQTHQAGRHGGVVGHAALQVLHTLIFDFLNYMSGRLDPSYAAIARKANVCQRTVATAIQKLAAPRHPQLGQALRRELEGRAVRAGAADERLCDPPDEPMARLRAADGGAGA